MAPGLASSASLVGTQYSNAAAASVIKMEQQTQHQLVVVLAFVKWDLVGMSIILHACERGPLEKY
jgi:hypothetical protein